MKRFLALFFLGIFLFLVTPKIVLSTSLEECEKEDIPAEKVGECINILSQKVTDLTAQKKSLSSQIAQFDNQIRLTGLKITDAEKTINQLEKEIGVLGFRIGYITDSVDRLETLLKQRIVATYQQGFVSNLELLVTSRDFSDLILRVQYLRQVQENDKKILGNLLETKANYANQKDDRETKQAAIEENKKKLLGLKASLDQQKSEKQAFLEVTKNDETRYQRLLAQAQAERAIVFGGGTDVFLRDVSQGATIGNVASYGNSPGCSSGAHLHFEVHKNNSVQDPGTYLQPIAIQYHQGYDSNLYGSVNPSGNLPWPLNEPVYLNQGFGAQKNSPYYGPGGHAGIDIQTGSGNASGNTVKAVKNGKLYGGSYNCSGGKLYYAKVIHDDGLVTWYLHMIPN